ncbi:MAG TPA: BNR repeat-containing protein [Sphingobacterium sp.]|nr:BNR repeat-containing protein [Sphingobacterium sp.]
MELGEKTHMVGSNENRVTYPEFYKMPDGNVLFLYRDGASGSGNLLLNKYDVKSGQWSRLQSNLISGEGQRNAYWQAFVDLKGTIHLSWVWRESPDVASNHDMAYACSKDGGLTWQNSKGVQYELPITAANAEYAVRIPQQRELINQTGMSADDNGTPFIVSYWREAATDIPQYKLIYHTGTAWKVRSLDFRKTPFSLSGAGTKRIPISRPQVMVKGKGAKATVLILFRDEERGNRPSSVHIKRLKNEEYDLMDLRDISLGSWEPTYDTELWRTKKILNLFIQHAEQKDGEGVFQSPAQTVKVLEWKP